MAAPTPLSSVPDDVFNCVCLVPPPVAPPSKADLLALLGEFWAVADARFGLSGYIWQRQPLQLAVVQEQEASTPRGGDASSDGRGDCQWVIKGRLAYGDNVEDEWFAVFLLYQLSNMHDGLVIRMDDTDGDFLLIEAALVIPRWLKPKNSRNRVLLSRGKIHIVPRTASIPRRPALLQAAAVVADPRVATEASDEVQACISRRISVYPKHAMESTHTAKCFLPEPVARVLQREPRLVAPAVTAFYTRDAADISAAARMTVFPVTPGVFTMVSFSRCLYAQLTQQQFHPPKVFQKVMLPVDDPDYSAADLGMKLACGFEMLMNRGPGGALHLARRRGDSSTSAGDDGAVSGGGCAMSDEQFLRVKATPEWTQYKAALAARGFFHDLHDGSVQFLARERKAAQSLLSSRPELLEDDSVHPSVRVADVLAEPSTWALEPWPPAVQPDDDAAWLKEQDAKLEQALSQYQQDMESFTGAGAGAGAGTGEVGDDAGATRDPVMARGVQAADDLVRSLTAFVGQQSDFRGVEPATGGPPPAATGRGGEPRVSFADDTKPPSDEPATPPFSSEGSSHGGIDGTPTSRPAEWIFADAADSDGSDSTDDEHGESGLAGPTRPGHAASSGTAAGAGDSSGDDDSSDSEGEITLEVSRLFALLSADDAGLAREVAHVPGGAKTDVPANAPTDVPDNTPARATSPPAVAQGIGASGEEHVDVDAGCEDPSVSDIMVAMDAQLRGTTLAKSFKRVGDAEVVAGAGDGTVKSATAASLDLRQFAGGDDDGSVDSDDEVGLHPASARPAAGASASVGAGGGRASDGSNTGDGGSGEGSDDSDGELAPVQVDFNLVSNLLASVQHQQGQAGPASNLLGEIGVSWQDALAATRSVEE